MEQTNNFDNELHCRLYSDVERIIHPTISKKNIASYKIVLNEEIVPVRVFYPEKVSNLNKVIIYIHGISSVSLCGNHYFSICSDLAIKTKQLVVAVDYDETKPYLNCLDDCLQCVKFLKDELEKSNIDISYITLMGDSIGATMVLGINRMLDGLIKKSILISPILSSECLHYGDIDKNDKANIELVSNLQRYYNKSLLYKKNYKDSLVFPVTSKDSVDGKLLFVVGDRDILKDVTLKYADVMNGDILEIELANHNFLKDMNLDVRNVFYSKVVTFLEE